jgi:predicted nucleic-acid-binding protein
MIGLDTNIILRYLRQDDSAQSPRVNRIFEQQLSVEHPGFISIAATLELVWVMRSVMKLTSMEIAAHLQEILTTKTVAVQNRQQVYEAVCALEDGTGEFEDALIGALNSWAGCSTTLTFDRKAARLQYFQQLA